MREEVVEQAIIQLIADLKGRDAAGLEAELRAAGPGLPVDSLTCVQIVVALEAQFGVALPSDLPTAHAMRSVRALARRMCTVGRKIVA
ncbi:MAG: acyl carrier protein [Dehalococcoidia bacterium]